MTDSAQPRADAARIRTACEQLSAQGHPVTFTAVASLSGVSRATCYRRQDLRAVIDGFRSREGIAPLTVSGLAERVDGLSDVIEAVAEQTRSHGRIIRELRRRAGPPPDRPASGRSTGRSDGRGSDDTDEDRRAGPGQAG